MKHPGRELAEYFGSSRSAIARWGRALKSGDMKEMEVAFSGQGAMKKLDAPAGTTSFSIPLNNAQDLRLYGFEYQENKWERDESFRKIVVRATNPSGETIEVSILCSDPTLSAGKTIRAIFRRWLQENGFGYMDRHVGINETTSRAHRKYSEIVDGLTDRSVASRSCKAKKKEKTKLEGKLKTNLLNRRKLLRTHLKKSQAESVGKFKSNNSAPRRKSRFD